MELLGNKDEEIVETAISVLGNFFIYFGNVPRVTISK
jgi:hypothetical protein